MAKKLAIVNKFNADQATAAASIVIDTTEKIKKGKYRVFNGTDYDVVYLQTSAEQVIENEKRKFVSKAEKDIWNKKAEWNHHHDNVYAKIGASHTRSEMEALLNAKANLDHSHAASNVIVDSTHQFVTNDQITRWNDTYTIEQIDSKVETANRLLQDLGLQNSAQHTSIIKGYEAADKLVENKVATVQSNLNEAVENLKGLINTGGTANATLTARVEKIEKTTIPEVKQDINNLDSRLTGETARLEEAKANKSQVEIDINLAKATLQNTIDTKANKSYVDDNLTLKANVDDVYDKEFINSSLSSKADKNYVSNELNKKADKTELNKKASTEYVDTALQSKASVQALDTGLASKAEKVHQHKASEISELGTAATLNVGKDKGNIPVLNAQGKLEPSILPSIAINQKVTADTTDEAMEKQMAIGDILILTTTAREDAMQKQAKGQAITYKVSKSKMYQELSDEYTTYIASGKMTYLCVDPSAERFEDRFKPLQSSGDTISSAEVETKLELKVDTTIFNNYKTDISKKLDLKADKENTFTKEEVNNALEDKVSKVNGKDLSTNDFTTDLKNKLEHIDDEANNYSHPTGDGNLHVPETKNNSYGKVLMAGASAGSLNWKALTTANVSDSTSKRYVTDDQIAQWTAKADSNHEHEQYRLANESYTQAQTKTEINKLKTIVSTAKPATGSHIVGAVWIEEL